MIEFAIVLLLAGTCLYLEWSDKRAGRYPRNWR